MTTASGLNPRDVAILDAGARAGASPGGHFVRCDGVLDMLREATGFDAPLAYEQLLDLARPWVSHLTTLDVRGNIGDPDFGPADPEFTECRLTPLGDVALATEHGQRPGPLPIGLINGDLHRGGSRPPFDPRRVLAAIRRAPDLNDDELVSAIGPPTFPTDCVVSVDLAALACGLPTDLTTSARITVEGDDRVVVSHLPPGSSVGAIAGDLSERISNALPGERPPIRDAVDQTARGRARLIVLCRSGATGEVANYLRTVRGVERTLRVQLDGPLALQVRAFAGDDADEVDARLAPIDAAVRE